jgi:RsmE family RNA methyltransferase
VNLLLLAAHELAADGTVELADRRARHLLAVLGVAAGDTVRAGIEDGPVGHAEILSVAGHRVRLRCHCSDPAAPADDALLLAMPRPKVLVRILEHAAALGFGRIVLFRSWRVEKSHLQSHALRREIQRAHLVHGLEQSGRTRLPEVLFFPRFRPFVEDVLPTLPLPGERFCAHPRARTGTAELAIARGLPFALALGPEGGFLPWEVEQLAQRGFCPVRLGPHALRTESALAVLYGQLDLLRQRG